MNLDDIKRLRDAAKRHAEYKKWEGAEIAFNTHATPDAVLALCDLAERALAQAKPVTDTGLPELRDVLKIAAVYGEPVLLSSASASELCHAMTTGAPQGEAAQPVALDDDLLQQAIDACDVCMDETQVEPEDAAAWQVVRRALLSASSVAGQWISVDDRLPEEGETVFALIYPYNNEENKRIATHAIYGDGSFLNHEGDDLHPPTHWMPMPDIAALTQPNKE